MYKEIKRQWGKRLSSTGKSLIVPQSVIHLNDYVPGFILIQSGQLILGEQFRRLVNKALQSREQTGLALLKLLERRLDNIIYHLGFARTRIQARQFVTHGHVRVNGEPVNIPSALVQPDEEIQLDDTLSQIPDVREMEGAKPLIPEWLEKRNHGGVVLREPNREEIDPDIQEQRIVEFYSRCVSCSS